LTTSGSHSITLTGTDHGVRVINATLNNTFCDIMSGLLVV